jgi:hypothetical protein
MPGWPRLRRSLSGSRAGRWIKMPLPYEQWTCAGCGLTNAERDGIEGQYSLGLYAGRWHQDCWQKGPYRKEGREGFDPADAGESYEEID